MVDSGAMHNFVALKFVQQAGLRMNSAKLSSMSVLLADGMHVATLGHCVVLIHYGSAAAQHLLCSMLDMHIDIILGIP